LDYKVSDITDARCNH